MWTREVRVLRRASFATQDATMDELMRRYRVVRLAMDQTGMGEKPVEDAIRRYGAARVEGVQFTGAHKLALAVAAKQAFEDRTIRIPAGDVAIRADLHKLKKITGPTGIPRFVAETDSAGHADRAWACFLACAASDAGAFEYGYTPARMRGGDDALARSGLIDPRDAALGRARGRFNAGAY